MQINWTNAIRIKVFRYITALFCILLVFDASADSGRLYTVGIVPQFEVHRLHAIWLPILIALEKRTGLKFKLIGSPEIPAFEKEFLAGKFDFAYMNPYHILAANRNQGYEPLIRDNGNQLYGVMVVRKDSPVQDVRELDGKVLAVPSPNALGASLLLRTELYNLFKINLQLRNVRSHDSVYLNVALGLADAGGGVQKTFNKQPKQIKNSLRILYRTINVSPHPFAAHPRVPDEIKMRVREAFLAMGRNATGKNLLSRIPIKKIGPANMHDYEPLGTLGLERFFVK